MNKTPMTVQGAEALRQELNELKTVARPKVIAAISEARAHGDLKENAEYHAAREQQSFIEGRIKVIDVSTLNAGGRVVFGATVDVLDLETDEEHSYKIVGEDEADIRESRISVTSPIARALIGKTEGDEVEIQVPGGVREFEVLEVRYV